MISAPGDDFLLTWVRCSVTHALALLLVQSGHLYCLICSARAGVILTHLPWYHFSQLSQQIQNWSLPSLVPQVPHRVLSCSSASSSPSSSPLSSPSLGTLAFERDSALDCCKYRSGYQQELRLDGNRKGLSIYHF